MRLHHLAITAFGPFAGTVTVDFDQLSADGLFLLHGATGAGKTTILDAVAFALYGRVPGVRNEGKRLKSDHAGADAAPTVVLEATLGGRRLRMTRTAAYRRPKSRGEGFREINATATLTWLDGNGNNLTRAQEIGDLIKDLVGMSAEQFFQVVLLPQGQFAEFLVSDNDVRAKLLERLFDTGRFKTAEEWLAARRRELASGLVQLTDHLDRLVSEVKGVTGAEPPVDEFGDWVADLCDAAQTRADAAKRAVEAGRAARVAAQAQLASESALEERLKRRAAALDALAQLDSQAPHFTELEIELSGAKRASQVGFLDGQLQAAKADQQRATRGVYQRVQALESDSEGAGLVARIADLTGEEQIVAVELAVAGWHSELGRLAEIVPRVAELAAHEIDRDRNLRLARELAAHIDGLTKRRDELPARVSMTESELAEQLTVAGRASELVAARDRCAEQLAAAEQLEKQLRALTAAEATFSRRRDQHLNAREIYLDVRERRLSSMAAELAAALEPGQSCSVCGSIEHPARAIADASAVTKDEEAAARLTEEGAAVAKERAQQAVADAKRAADLLASQSAGKSLTELRSALAELQSGVARAQGAKSEADTLTGILAEVRARQEELSATLNDALQRQTATSVGIQSSNSVIERLQQSIERVCGSSVDPIAKQNELQRLTTRASALRDSLANLRATDEAVAALVAQAESAATAAGFVGLADAVSAVRTVERQKVIEHMLQEQKDCRGRAIVVLDDTDADKDRAPQVGVAKAASERANTAVEEAVAAFDSASTEVRRLTDLAVALSAAEDSIAPKQAEFDELAALADLVAGGGQNQRKMSLRSYVLAARLEEVAAEASVRLRRMSGGRYEFVHTDAAGYRGTRGGLGLDVRDLYNDRVRSVKTLSGGEKFMASLACALGLSDVVANEAGGTILDTLFIDEGFGSLDGESLDAVMGVIDELREGGRIIGVVSHVEGMHQRIPSRLHVVRGQTGSRLELQVS